MLVAAGACAVANRLDPGASSTYSTSVALASTATLVAVLFILINGPQPRWATRWAWFWLMLNPALLVMVPLFLIVSGPIRTTVEPTRPTGRRLTGGWAFLLGAVVLSGVKVHF